MVLNFVTHRHNIDKIDRIIELCIALEADFVELATCQFYGWAHLNRLGLLPTRAQLERAERITNEYREQLKAAGNPCKLIFVTPDYYEERPKACMNGWGSLFLTITPDGTALPCHGARQLPVQFPNVRDHDLRHIWYDSFGFNRFRGYDWMPEPCRSCDEGKGLRRLPLPGLHAHRRCQQRRPGVRQIPDHGIILKAREEAQTAQLTIEEMTFRNERNSRIITRG